MTGWMHDDSDFGVSKPLLERGAVAVEITGAVTEEEALQMIAAAFGVLDEEE
jgi:hypothetical protein